MMSETNLIALAKQRAIENSFPYAGTLTPTEAYTLLQQHDQAILIDVRTNAERDWVGRVILTETQHHAVQ